MKTSIYVLALGAFGIITTEFGIVGILPTISRQFDVSIDTAGWLLSAFAINFTMLMVARILPAILHPLFWNIAIAIAFKEKGAKGVSTVMLGLSLATVLGIPLTTYAVDLFQNWQASFFLSSAISLIAFIGLLLFIPSMPADQAISTKNQVEVLKSPLLWLNLISTIATLAAMFASYTYLTAYLEEITKMDGAQISMMLLLFGGMGTLGNWLMGLALNRNVLLTARLFLMLLVTVQILAYYFGGHYIPMVVIVSLWGMIHTGGFLVSNIRTTQSVPHHALEFVTSLLTSSFNIGISLGAFLGGIISVHYGVHYVLWVSILLLSVTFILSFVSFPKKISENEEESQLDRAASACVHS